MHVYSFSAAYKLQDHYYSSKDGKWIEGSLEELNIEVQPNSSLAACQWAGDEGQTSIRVYYQGPCPFYSHKHRVNASLSCYHRP